MFQQARAAVLMLLIMTGLTGVVYPFVITAIAQTVFSRRANGSLLVDQGRVVGSEWIGQLFSEPGYFWPRPSATPQFPYNSASSSGSNLGPLSPDLRRQFEERVRILRASDPENTQPIPADLVAASGSGLDPHISPQAARWQSARVAKARGLPREVVDQLIERHIEQPQLGVLGEGRVNVLLLNRALDKLK